MRVSTIQSSSTAAAIGAFLLFLQTGGMADANLLRGHASNDQHHRQEHDHLTAAEMVLPPEDRDSISPPDAQEDITNDPEQLQQLLSRHRAAEYRVRKLLASIGDEEAEEGGSSNTNADVGRMLQICENSQFLQQTGCCCVNGVPTCWQSVCANQAASEGAEGYNRAKAGDTSTWTYNVNVVNKATGQIVSTTKVKGSTAGHDDVTLEGSLPEESSSSEDMGSVELEPEPELNDEPGAGLGDGLPGVPEEMNRMSDATGEQQGDSIEEPIESAPEDNSQPEDIETEPEEEVITPSLPQVAQSPQDVIQGTPRCATPSFGLKGSPEGCRCQHDYDCQEGCCTALGNNLVCVSPFSNFRFQCRGEPNNCVEINRLGPQDISIPARPESITIRPGSIPSIGDPFSRPCTHGEVCKSKICASSPQVTNGVCVDSVPSGWTKKPYLAPSH